MKRLKRGTATSEFRLTFAVIIGQLAAALVGQMPPEWAGVSSTVAAVGYAFARGFAKAGGAEEIVNIASKGTPQ